MQVDSDHYLMLERRIGRAYLTQRLAVEALYGRRATDRSLAYRHIAGMHWAHWLGRLILKMLGVYWRGQKNARRIVLRQNRLVVCGLPSAFEGLRLLHLSDLHLDLSPAITDAVAAMVAEMPCELGVITGDFRSRAWGPFDVTLRELARLRASMQGELYAVLGNHDAIGMVPEIEQMGIRVLLNEAVPLTRERQVLYLAGIDDAHAYQTDNIQKASLHLDHHAPAILLSHTPEAYRKAAACGFAVMLCGHTHGGQICAPGGMPLVLNARVPLRLCRGAWKYRNLIGYTSVGTGCSGIDVRFWNPPEVTLHTLTGASSEPDPSRPIAS